MQRGKGLRAGSAGQRAEPQGQSHKGRPQGQLPSTPPSFIACQSQSHSPRSMHTRRVTNRSPSALRCHHTVREQKIRYETGWWLGYLTISGLGTLTALQITSIFAGDCSVRTILRISSLPFTPFTACTVLNYSCSRYSTVCLSVFTHICSDTRTCTIMALYAFIALQYRSLAVLAIIHTPILKD